MNNKLKSITGRHFMDIFLSIDLGTTGLKTAIITGKGIVLESEYFEYPIITKKHGYAEQNADLWWEGFVKGCKKIKEKRKTDFSKIKAIGICGQMHTHVYLDKNSKILRPAITWMDQRSVRIVDGINSDEDKKNSVFKNTQNIATATYTATQVKWVMENEKDLWGKVCHVLVAKDYLKYRLTGRMATDYSDASGTLLFNVAEKKWSDEMFKFFNIPRSLFPDVSASNSVMGYVSKEAALLTGLTEGIPVVNGSSDNSAAALGGGMIKSGQVTLIIGTAGVITVCSDKPLVDKEHKTLCWNYCLEDKWATLAVTQTAGESLNWFKEAFDAGPEDKQRSSDIFMQYDKLVEGIPDGANGLVFLPYLNGERTPYWDSHARGVFYGINLFSKKPHFIRAVMEGVAFSFRNCMETIENLGIDINEIRAVGGGLKSTVWLNILGKILKKNLYTVERTDTGLIGNMLIALKALDKSVSLDKRVSEIVEYKNHVYFDTVVPDLEKQYQKFIQLYENLKGIFKI